MVEKREYPRLKTEFPIKYEVIPLSLPRPLMKPDKEGLAVNISGGGLYVIISNMKRSIINKLIKHSLKMSIELYLPDFHNRIKVLGDIQWAKTKSKWWQIWDNEWHLGVKYSFIQNEDRDCIVKYVINKQIEDRIIESP